VHTRLTNTFCGEHEEKTYGCTQLHSSKPRKNATTNYYPSPRSLHGKYTTSYLHKKVDENTIATTHSISLQNFQASSGENLMLR